MELADEIQALRAVLEERQKRIDLLEAHFQPASVLDLQELAIEGGVWYCKKNMEGAPIVEKTAVKNAVAHGIVMGFRKKEEMMGISIAPPLMGSQSVNRSILGEVKNG